MFSDLESDSEVEEEQVSKKSKSEKGRYLLGFYLSLPTYLIKNTYFFLEILVCRYFFDKIYT